MLLTIVIFILILGLLVFVHEFGHFFAAKKNGVRVDEFGFGFPPRIFGIKKGETLYSINLIPLGGFVKIYGEEGEGEKNPRSFASKKISQRALILVAGVAMNFLLAAIIFGVGHFAGLPGVIEESEIDKFSDARIEIVGINLDSPAALAGLKISDRVLAMIDSQGEKIEPLIKVSQFQELIAKEKGKEIVLFLQRGDSIVETKLIPRIDHPAGEGPLGVALANVATIKSPWYEAFFKGFATAFNVIVAIFIVLFDMIANLFTQGTVGIEVAGPVGIFSLTGQAAQLGLIYILQFIALLSINLAVINALPFPALDGGRLLFLVIEKIKGRPVSQKAQNLAHGIGFALLILLMMAVTYKDLTRFF